VNLRLGVVLTVTLCASAAYTLTGGRTAPLGDWMHSVTPQAPATGAQPVLPRPEWPARPAPLLGEPTDRSVQDLYGNDVSDAVARYKADPEGTVYEEHSPQTEIPYLKPPTT
jgi:hypothetical protein